MGDNCVVFILWRFQNCMQGNIVTAYIIFPHPSPSSRSIYSNISWCNFVSSFYNPQLFINVTQMCMCLNPFIVWNLSTVIVSRKNVLPSLSSHSLLIVPVRCMPRRSFPTSMNKAGLSWSLYLFCVAKHNWCEFLSLIVLTCPKDSIYYHSFSC